MKKYIVYIIHEVNTIYVEYAKDYHKDNGNIDTIHQALSVLHFESDDIQEIINKVLEYHKETLYEVKYLIK